MQLVTFKTSYVISRYDDLIREHRREYLKEIEKLISALMNYKEPISWFNQIYNKIFKIEEKSVDKSWIRILERSLCEDYNFEPLKQYRITMNDLYYTCLVSGSFGYIIHHIIEQQSLIKNLIKEKQGLIRSEFPTVQVDQDEIKRLRLHE